MLEAAIQELGVKLAQAEVNNAMYVAKIKELEAKIKELEGAEHDG